MVEDELDPVAKESSTSDKKAYSSVDPGKKRKNADDLCPSTTKKKIRRKQGSTLTKDSSSLAPSSSQSSRVAELPSNQKTLKGYRIPKKSSNAGDDATERITKKKKLKKLKEVAIKL